MSNLWETHAALFDDAEQVILTDESPVEYERQEPTFYARIPKLAIMSLNPYELALYTHYKQTASDNGYCNKSNGTLAREAQMSVSKVKDARQTLLEKGFISVEYHPDEDGVINTPPTIKIVDLWQKNHETYSVGVVAKKQGGGRQKTTPSHQKTPKKNQSKKNQKEEISVASDDAGVSDVSPESKRKPDAIFDTLAELHWNIHDTSQVDKTTAIRINKIKSWLKDNSPGATAETLRSFATWFADETNGLSLPRDVAKFAERFVEFREYCAKRKNGNGHAPVTPMVKMSDLSVGGAS